MPPASPTPPWLPPPHDGPQPVAAARAAAPFGRIILLTVNLPLLVVYLVLLLTQPAASPASGVQLAPTGTAGPVLTTAPQMADTPTATASSGAGSGPHHHPTATPHARPTATVTAATATVTPTTPPVATATPSPTGTPAPTATPIPTVSAGG